MTEYNYSVTMNSNIHWFYLKNNESHRKKRDNKSRKNKISSTGEF